MTTSPHQADRPACFGKLDHVFPKGENGLRNSPNACLACELKTQCLRTAMQGKARFVVHQEMVDRAYSSGRLSFWQRWSRKKAVHRNKNQKDNST